MKLLSTLVVSLSLFPFAAVAEEPLSVSMIQLVATPTEYHGKLIAVKAFLHLEFEGDALYLHREDYLRRIYKNGIWIELLGRRDEAYMPLSDHYVEAIGIFDAESKGHFGMWSGTLKSVRGLRLLP